MNLPAHLNLRQRYNLTVFIAIALAYCLLIGLLYKVIDNYADDYTSHYWQDYTKTFSDAVKYSVIMRSTSVSEALTHNFASDKNVLKASIYNNHYELLASSGSNLDCMAVKSGLTRPFVIETHDYWCFYAPITQEDTPLGHVELIISKADLKSVFGQLLGASGLIILVFMVFVFSMVRHFSGFFTTTLVEMAAVLKEVSQGARGKRVSFSGAADIDMIRDVVNDMLTQIELNEQVLEQRVAERTSALKIALDSSQAANVYKSQLMAMVSHEMKTPLHAVVAGLQLLYEQVPQGANDELNKEFYTKSLNRANEMNGYIDNMLLHAKLEANKFELSLASVDMKSLMQGCADKMAVLQERNRNGLTLSGPDISVLGDAEVLSHIVNNLLSNACKFTLEGDINVNWRLDRSVLVIQVSDTGCGIPDEFRAKIFDAFWQIDMSLSRKYGGYGLGLAIVQQFVQRLDGDITVEANEVRGTVFTIKIPNSLAPLVHPQ